MIVVMSSFGYPVQTSYINYHLPIWCIFPTYLYLYRYHRVFFRLGTLSFSSKVA